MIDLQIGHDKKVIVAPFSVSVQQGDCIAILGRNGSGKSTLLHTICKFIQPLSGKIMIDGESLENLNFRQLATKISIVLSGRRDVIPQVNVMDILKMGRFPYTGFYARLSKTDTDIIDETIELLKLRPFLDKSISQLSDGEAQKVFIGRALIQDTPVMLFDEPTTHLDTFNKKEIFNIIRQLLSRNKTIFISTHEITDVLQIVNRVLLIDEGCVKSYRDTEMGEVRRYFEEMG